MSIHRITIKCDHLGCTNTAELVYPSTEVDGWAHSQLALYAGWTMHSDFCPEHIVEGAP